MGLFDFLKKKKAVEVKKERVSFNKLEDWIKNTESKNKETEEDILKDVKKRIILFTNDLDDNIQILKNIDIDEKKVEVRIKNIVKTALNIYIDQLLKLKKNILETNTMQEVTSTLHNFEDKTVKTYQKVTFLIGKEMVNVKKTFQNLYKFLNDIEDKELIKTNKTITAIKKRLEELKNIDNDINRLNEENKELTLEIKELKTQEKQIKEQIQNIKNSKEHLNNLKKIEDKTKDENTLKQLIQELRLLIDFKKLTSIFHSSENFMSKIKHYKEKFSDAIEEQNPLLEMLDEANLNNEKIKTKFKEIQNLKEKIINTKIEDDKTKQLEPKLKDIQDKINNISPKENTKLKQRKEEITSSIKQELKKVNMNLTK